MRAAFALLVGITATVGVTHAETFDIYILAGQSNMSGRAPLEGIPTFKNAAHVFAYRAGRWQPAHEPIADEPEAKLGPSFPLRMPSMIYARMQSDSLTARKVERKLNNGSPAKTQTRSLVSAYYAPKKPVSMEGL